jgi:fatty acid desaturase
VLAGIDAGALAVGVEADELFATRRARTAVLAAAESAALRVDERRASAGAGVGAASVFAEAAALVFALVLVSAWSVTVGFLLPCAWAAVETQAASESAMMEHDPKRQRRASFSKALGESMNVVSWGMVFSPSLKAGMKDVG